MIKKSKQSYCDDRLLELEISDQDNSIMITHENGRTSPYKYFKSDDRDNIIISYPSLYGTPIFYDNKGKQKEFSRTRINPRNIINGAKYLSPYKSGSFFFWPPPIIDAFRNKTPINTLIVTEGEFKAFKACKHGIPCVGIAGIHNYKDKTTGDLHASFKELIESCRVKNIIYLLDADCISESYIKECIDAGKDLHKRLHSFFIATKNFRELCKEFDRDVYFSQINPEFEGKAKGLDDLLLFCKGQEIEVKNDLEKLEKSRNYFTTVNISDSSVLRLQKYFFLNKDRKFLPSSFYERFQGIIEEKEFLFNNLTYQYSNSRLNIINHPSAKVYIRVKTDYYRLGYTLTSKKEKVPQLIPWTIGAIRDDFGHIKDFTKMISKYVNFTNIPDNTSEYQRVIEECYNLYEPIKHISKQGSITSTEMFLRHLFGDKYDLALDYLTILHKFPTQNLPIICLVSKTQNTGKTTYLKWLNMIYDYNAIILGNEDFAKEFNTHFASKLIIGIDESFIDQKLLKEKIKRLATENRINLEAKGKDITTMDFHGKLILTSNNENNFIQMDEEDNRFFVVKVPEVEKEDPDLKEKLLSEIPAWLYFIENREIIYPKESRLWFDPKAYVTEALMKVVKGTKNRLEKAMKAWCEDVFDFDEECDEIRVIPKLFATELRDDFRGTRGLESEIQRILQDNWGLSPVKNGWFDFPRLKDSYLTELAELQKTNTRGRYYSITRSFINTL